MKFLVAIVLLASPFSAFAQFVACNGCTESQYETTALNLGLGDRYIADLTNHVASAYHVSREPAGNGKYTYAVDPADMPASYQSGFNAWDTYEKAHPSSAPIIVTVPNPPPPNTQFPTGVFNYTGLQWASLTNPLSTLSGYMINLQGCLTCYQGWDSMSPAGFAMIADLLAAQSPVSITVVGSKLEVAPIQLNITTTDGSQIQVQYANGTATLTQVIDKYKNNIPLNKNQAAGRAYEVPPNDTTYKQALGNYLGQLGYGISTGGGSGGTGGTLHWVCVESVDDGGNTIYTCTGD